MRQHGGHMDEMVLVVLIKGDSRGGGSAVLVAVSRHMVTALVLQRRCPCLRRTRLPLSHPSDYWLPAPLAAAD